ncbi:unnamed protein product [Discosporangium mesarthrocarpum]
MFVSFVLTYKFYCGVWIGSGLKHAKCRVRVMGMGVFSPLTPISLSCISNPNPNPIHKFFSVMELATALKGSLTSWCLNWPIAPDLPVLNLKSCTGKGVNCF